MGTERGQSGYGGVRDVLTLTAGCGAASEVSSPARRRAARAESMGRCAQTVLTHSNFFHPSKTFFLTPQLSQHSSANLQRITSDLYRQIEGDF